jgi:hypothetical protein
MIENHPRLRALVKVYTMLLVIVANVISHFKEDENRDYELKN